MDGGAHERRQLESARMAMNKAKQGQMSVDECNQVQGPLSTHWQVPAMGTAAMLVTARMAMARR